MKKMEEDFRKVSGQKMYCSIMTIIDILKKGKMRSIENIKKIFAGKPTVF